VDSTNFTIHKIEGYIENIYMVQYDGGSLLFDSGCISDVKRIEAYCRANDLSLGDIKLIALSHMHPDHSGGAALLRDRYGIPIAAHTDADLWYSGWGGSLQYKFDCYMARIVALRNRRRFERLLSKRRLNPDYYWRTSNACPVLETASLARTGAYPA
jgi:glyoxylase-like metal-dependent hydrolase (beta-lactamase superfamily II)